MPLMSAEAVIERLMTLHPKGYDLSLGRISGLLERLGNPQNNLPPVIHIAGTNGKGSASAFCRALIEASGHTCHVHTSPHLVKWHERFRIGAKTDSGFVEDAKLNEALILVEAANGGNAITVFEILTAAMFLLFSEHPADAAIIEVGLGGRFDATNVIMKPAVSLVMPIAFDHVAFLGDTIDKIAFEKAGIFKRGAPAVIGQQGFELARETLIERAMQVGARPIAVYGQDYLAFEEHGRMVYQDEDGLYDLPLPALNGRHQLANAAAAIAAVKAAGFTVDQEIAERAMQSVYWPARMQALKTGKLIELAPKGSELYVDGGHNPHAGTAVAEALVALEEQKPRPLFLICGMLTTKEPRGYFEAFEGIVRHVFTVPIEGSEAGYDPETLADLAMEAGLTAEAAASPEAVLLMLRDQWNGLEQAPRILIGGSLYLAGAVLDANGTPPV
ncbi:MAG: bifunctional folylpolyglutamate synthase/dihydrofolate synthase [Notoacmeibacter sp.]